MSQRSEALAERLVQGAVALASFARSLTDAEWNTPIPRDGRTVGTIVHHVATMYPLEIELARQIAAGQAVTGVTWDDVHHLNAQHAKEFADVTKDEAITLLARNGAVASRAIRALTDEQLDTAAPISLNADAPLTCQFMLEDHAVRHSYHHLQRIQHVRGSLPEARADVSERADEPVLSA
ncbi:MAG TPA: DinB family protein [Gemmatimonadaceae bacterium]|nr:DinB family protein [Gemmatimonadaceae bacterium]